MLSDPAPGPERPERASEVIDLGVPVGGGSAGPSALDTGAAEAAEVAAQVAWARIHGATEVRTTEPRSARRAATVIDAIVAAGGG